MQREKCKESSADVQKVMFINTHRRQLNDISFFFQRLVINLMTIHAESDLEVYVLPEAA
jgi:hypothetical protein